MPWGALGDPSAGLIDMMYSLYAVTDWPQRSREDRKGTALDRPGIDGVAHFAAGLVAGMCAKLASHPLDVVKKRYQVAGLQRSLRCGEVWGSVCGLLVGRQRPPRWWGKCRKCGEVGWE